MKKLAALIAIILLAANAFALSFVYMATLNGSEGGLYPGFSHPANIALDSDGRIYVADPGNSRIVVYSQDLTYMTSRGGVLGSGPTELE